MIEIDLYRDSIYDQRNEQAVVTDIGVQKAEFDAFRVYLTNRFPGNERVLRAFDIAREAHGEDKRKSKQLYFGHITSVTKFGIEALGLEGFESEDPELLPDLTCAWLLHDTLEDTDEDIKKMHYPDWVKKTKVEFIPKIGERATEFLIGLTRPQVNNADILSEVQAKKMYFDYLYTHPMAVVAKIPDYSDNIRTLEYFSVKKQNKKIEAILDIYVPILINHLGAEGGKYNHIFNYALSETMFVIGRLKRKQKKENNPNIEEKAS